MVKDLPAIGDLNGVCEGCQLGKMHRQPFPASNAWRASQKLQLVHTDVCGPMRTPSLDNSRYFILFIDDVTRMTWVYFLKERSEVFRTFQKFKKLVENQSGCQIQTLRSDRGTEYTSTEFNKFCEDEGVERQLTVGYSPQQNGVSERKNRTVMEMARSMLKDKGMPNKFWAEAVYTAVYLQNRCTTKAVSDMTPLEAWLGHKPSVKHLKVFGSICYMHVPAQKRHKLEAKAEKGIFLGYSSQSKGYRVYNLQTGKVQVSRDVTFDEESSWNWEKNIEDPALKVLPSFDKDEKQSQPFSDSPQNQESHHDDSTIQETPQRSSTESSPTNSPRSGESSSSKSSAQPPQYNIATGRERRQIKPPQRYADQEFCESCHYAVQEPTSYDEAAGHQEWRLAMEEEIRMIEKNQTWELTDKPAHKDVIGVKWIYKTKLNPDGSIQKHKARLVAKGFTQQFGVDYNETFAPVSRQDTVRTILALSAQKGWKVFQMDVKSAFLNGILDEEIYVEQPPGFELEEEEEKVLKLKKALYGLKQAPRAWYSRIDSYFNKFGFKRSPSEPTLYVKAQEADILIVSLYVDDLIVTGSNSTMITTFKEDMKKEFEMTDLGLMSYFLGMEINQTEEGIFICQQKYANNLLKKFKMEGSKPVTTPLVPNEKLLKEDGSPNADERLYRSLIGSLLYLTATRPDIMFATSLLSRFMQKPSQIHFTAAKRLLRYVKGTVDFGIWYKPTEIAELIGYTDSDWAGSLDDMKSTSGYVFSFGNGVFSWLSQKQGTVAQSSAEAEYIAGCAAANQAIWLRRILEEMGESQQQPTKIFCDSKSAIAIAKNPVQHRKTKHIKIKFHFLREAESDGEISLIYCSTDEQIADIFTKALPKSKFEFLRSKLGIWQKYIKEEC